MKTLLRSLAAWLCLASLASAPAAEADPLAQLDEALKAAAAFEYGNDAGPLATIEQIAVASVNDPAERAAVEQRLLGLLDRTATRDAKEFACRQLLVVGTGRAVPKLEGLLTDPALSHIARYTLGRIEGPEAEAALCRALGKTSGKLQVGILGTLASRRCRNALPEIVKLLAAPDAAVAEAAAAALGDLGGPEAVRALDAARPAASEQLRLRIDDALLACADRALAEGRPTEAAALYEKLHAADRAPQVRLGALRGLAQSRGAQAAGLLVAAIRGDDSRVRAAAIGFAQSVEGLEMTRLLVGLLPSLDPGGQRPLLRALGERGDPAAGPAVAAATQSQDEAVRLAALDALGGVGGAAAVELLARVAATGAAGEQNAARASLLRLRGSDIDGIMLRTLPAADPKVQVELIRALARRKAAAALGELFALARHNDSAVRREAMAALGALAGEPDLASLVALAVQPKEAGDRAQAEAAVAAAFERVRDRGKRAGPLLAALAAAPVEAQPTLLRLLVLAGTPEALGAVRAAIGSEDAAVRDAAVRALADWPDPAAAEDLLELARTAPLPAHKVLALRGYVRVAGLSADPIAMYARALQLASRVEDRKLVLAAFGSASSAEALELVEKHLGDEAVQAEAGLSAVQIAARLRETNAARARAALAGVMAAVRDPRVRQQAQEVINEIEQYEGYLLAWLVSDVYKAKGMDSRKLFDDALAPEDPQAAGVNWKPLSRGVGAWEISLDAALGSHEYSAVFLRTRVWSPAELDARLELGSDDAIKAWLNGKLVHANYVHRSMGPRQDLVPVKLQAGWNDLLLKVVNHSGGWGCCCRLRRRDGSALPELKVEAK